MAKKAIKDLRKREREYESVRESSASYWSSPAVSSRAADKGDQRSL